MVRDPLQPVNIAEGRDGYRVVYPDGSWRLIQERPAAGRSA